jgi:uncharacterized ferredoxin-like protein
LTPSIVTASGVADVVIELLAEEEERPIAEVMAELAAGAP